jgi:nucleotide-binding universal stress UspA family protein
MDEEARNDLRLQIGEQCRRLGVGEGWDLDVASGDPATIIATAAEQRGAALVIMGLGGHGIFDRILGDEMVLRVLRLGTVPVLAVAPNFTSLPRRVLAGLDFSSSSVRAVSLGAEIMNVNGKMSLVHVIPRDLDPLNASALDAGYQGGLGRTMDQVVANAGLGEIASVERRVLRGDPAKELLRLMAETDPDLIVAGSHGHNFLSRLLLGSVSTRLIRAANCSVLVAPPDDLPGFIEELPEERGRFAHYEWAEKLEDFSRRNGGRLARLEVIDAELGAQVSEKDTPFVGASYDPRSAQVQIMFELDGRGHYTRCISGVSAIQMLRDNEGRDVFLRVAHGRGQTLLTLER